MKHVRFQTYKKPLIMMDRYTWAGKLGISICKSTIVHFLAVLQTSENKKGNISPFMLLNFGVISIFQITFWRYRRMVIYFVHEEHFDKDTGFSYQFIVVAKRICKGELTVIGGRLMQDGCHETLLQRFNVAVLQLQCQDLNVSAG